MNSRLRAWFLAPSWAVMLLFFLAPLAIICFYSALTRGPYGGFSLPWTFESYARLFDPLYLRILGRSFWIAGISTGAVCCSGFRWLCLFRVLVSGRICIYVSDAAFLDQLSGADLRLDVLAAGHGTDQYRASKDRTDSRSVAAAL